MRVGSLFSGCGGMDLGLEQAGMEVVWQVEKMKFALKVLTRHWPKIPKHMDVLTFCVEDGHVKIIQSQVKEKVMQEKKADCLKSFAECCEYLIHVGLLARMFQGYYPSMPAKTFAKLSPSCKKSGMAFHGEYLIVNTSESLNNAVVSLLSDILEIHVHPKYYLSKKAVAGILRRSKKWSRGGYVFLQETDKDKTQRLKLLSVQQLEQMITVVATEGLKNQTSLPNQSSLQKINSEKLHQTEETLSHIPSIQVSEDVLEGYGKKLILRRLTPTEKEKLQGLPLGWTETEGSSLVMQSRSTLQNILVKE